MSCNRRYKRILLNDYLPVMDDDQDKMVGYVSNISISGAQLLGTKPFDSLVGSRLSIQLPPDLTMGGGVRLSGSLVWFAENMIPAFFDAGVHFGVINSQARKLIYELIARYGVDGVEDFGGPNYA